MRILKFGGTSLTSPEARSRAAKIVAARAATSELVVVTSALAGVTDKLTDCLAGRIPPEVLLGELETRHLGATDLLDDEREQVAARLDELRGLLAACRTPVFGQRILAAGERLALPLLAGHLRRLGLEVDGVDGTEVVETSLSGEIDLVATRQRAGSRLLCGDPQRVRLVTGFVAADSEGRTTTLGRGASDLSATLLASVLPSTVVEIWTDVDGILSGPPNLVAGPHSVPRLSYGEAAALAHFGAKVLHPLALAPVWSQGIPVEIRNTSNPSSAGTRIDPFGDPGPRFKAVSAVLGASRLCVWAPWGLRQAARIPVLLDESGIRPLLSAHGASAQTLSFVVHAKDAKDANRLLVENLGPYTAIERRDDLSVLAAVGDTGEPSIGAEHLFLQTLRHQEIRPLAITRPGLLTSEAEHCTAAVIETEQAPTALQLLHDRLVLETDARNRHQWTGENKDAGTVHLPELECDPPRFDPASPYSSAPAGRKRSAQIRQEPLIRLL